MTHTMNQKIWSKRLKDFRASGQSKSAWCEENKISKSALKYWLKKEIHEKADAKSGRAPKAREPRNDLFVLATGDGSANAGEVVYINIGRARIEARKGVDVGLLAAVLEAASSLC